MWGRHSHAWVIEHPTCPVEWQQATPLLGYQDFMATGQPDLAVAFSAQMFNRTMVEFRDAATGLVKTVDDHSMHYECSSGHPGMRIVDWMPDTPEFATGEGDHTVALGEFTASNFTSVDNFFAQRGLEVLASILATAPGRAADAARIALAASDLKSAIAAAMWNSTSSSFCDGVCEQVGGKSLLMTSIFSLCFGQVPPEHAAGVWAAVSRWGLEKIGDYGAFFYLMSVSGGGLYSGQDYEVPDDGMAILTALTKCDRYSWCAGLRDDNLTMTRESWHEGTYSHQWGTSPIVGVTAGVMGIRQTAPAWRSFTVRPKLGTLTYAEMLVPTISGYISVTATPTNLTVTVPCNTLARLCFPRSQADTARRMGRGTPVVSTAMLLDGALVSSVVDGGHVCTRASVGCGARSAARVISLA
jgi:alpha-L-rhamnosidase